MKKCVFAVAIFAAFASWAVSDHSVDEFPRIVGETDDAPRFQRAVDACRGGGLLTVPSGNYQFASTLHVTNLCSVKLAPAAVIRAVKPMKWMVEIDCTWEYNKKKAPPDVYARNFNLTWTGGILDGCGIASCLALDNYAHFILEKATFNNGRVYGVGVETHGRGYELMARDLYFHTSIPGIEGNTGLYCYGGDSHFIDIVSVNYTIGIHLAGRGSNRMSRCHVWGTSTRPIVKGVEPETLRESVCFRIDATDTVMRDCYADTGAIGFLIDSDTRLLGCNYFTNPVFNLDDIVCIKHLKGHLIVADCAFTKMAKHQVIYEGSGENVIWRDNVFPGYGKEEIPGAGSQTEIPATPQA